MNYELWIMNCELWIVKKKATFSHIFLKFRLTLFPMGCIFILTRWNPADAIWHCQGRKAKTYNLWRWRDPPAKSAKSIRRAFPADKGRNPEKINKNIESFDSIRNMEAKGERHVNLRPSGLRIYHGEFDPGSERTLAARLKHASRAWSVACYRESGGLVSNT